jgi:hypothetical protein
MVTIKQEGGKVGVREGFKRRGIIIMELKKWRFALFFGWLFCSAQ